MKDDGGEGEEHTPVSAGGFGFHTVRARGLPSPLLLLLIPLATFPCHSNTLFASSAVHAVMKVVPSSQEFWRCGRGAWEGRIAPPPFEPLLSLCSYFTSSTLPSRSLAFATVPLSVWLMRFVPIQPWKATARVWNCETCVLFFAVSLTVACRT